MHDCFRNLLQPSGVMLRPAVFSLKVYRAEDIPQSEYCIIRCLWFLSWIGLVCLHKGCARFPKMVKLLNIWWRKVFHCDWLRVGQFIIFFFLQIKASVISQSCDKWVIIWILKLLRNYTSHDVGIFF